MISRIRAPRLLPVTIGVLAVVLISKTTSLVHSAITSQPAAFITNAWASGPEAPPAAAKQGEKPGANQTEHGQPPKPDRGAETKRVGVDAPKVDEAPAALNAPPAITDSEKAVLLELRERRQELEARETSLAARESMLAAAEQKLSARVEELQGLQKKLESLDVSHRQQEDVAWQSLVKVYETMKPRDAATIFNELGMQVLLSVLDRMKETKASAILAAMAPEKARDVTTQLALSRTKASAALATGGKPAPIPESGKPPGSGT